MVFLVALLNDFDNKKQFCNTRLWADGYSSNLSYLRSRCNFVVISRAKSEDLKKVSEERNWTFPWYSCYNQESFAKDFGLQRKDSLGQLPAILAFHLQLDQTIEDQLFSKQQNGETEKEKDKEKDQKKDDDEDEVEDIDIVDYKGTIYHTYTTWRSLQPVMHHRGIDFGTIVWNFFDILPSGRGDFLPKGDLAVNYV